jgi:hypothetical protein
VVRGAGLADFALLLGGDLGDLTDALTVLVVLLAAKAAFVRRAGGVFALGSVLLSALLLETTDDLSPHWRSDNSVRTRDVCSARCGCLGYGNDRIDTQVLEPGSP